MKNENIPIKHLPKIQTKEKLKREKKYIITKEFSQNNYLFIFSFSYLWNTNDINNNIFYLFF